jgi:hypothetical protein
MTNFERGTFGAFGFERIEQSRDRLRMASREIDRIWSEFITTRSEFTVLGADDEYSFDLDPVRSLLAEADLRLSRTQVDVVVAGFLNRGKSTLLNSILGVEVSSMKVTPETARPVYVSYGDRRAWVAYQSGDSEVLEEIDPDDAARFGGLRPEESDDRSIRKPLRVIQQLPVPLLASGVVLKDTPGLDDANPDLADELEGLTLAELDRATATILVLCSPPGLSGSERQIIEGLDDRRVEKAFIVCNFYADQWDEDDEREAVLSHVRRSIADTPGANAKVFAVNAKRAWQARVKGDDAAFAASGMPELLTSLEQYLADGAFNDVLVRAANYLDEAKRQATVRIGERLSLLRDPTAVSAHHESKKAAVEEASHEIARTCETATEECSGAFDEVIGLILQPFTVLDQTLAMASNADEVRNGALRFDIQYEAALAQSSSTLSVRLREIERNAKAKLLASFDPAIDASTVPYARPDLVSGWQLPIPSDSSGGVDSAKVGIGVGVGAAVGAAALLFWAGPIGWIAGAALGALAGGFIGGSSGNREPRFDDQARYRMRADLDRRRVAATEGLRQSILEWSDRLETSLRSQFEDFAADSLAELRAVESILRDPATKNRLEAATEALKTSISSIDVTYSITR